VLGDMPAGVSRIARGRHGPFRQRAFPRCIRT